MTRAAAVAVLQEEAQRWASKSYDELITQPDTIYTVRRGDVEYQVDVQVIERKPDYVHVMVSVLDGTLRTFILPPTKTIIVHADG